MLIVSLVLLLIFASLSLIHVYWGFGGKWGLDSAVPKTESGELEFEPGMIVCFLVAILLLINGLIHIFPLTLFDFLPAWIQYIYWLTPIIFFLRGIGDFKYSGVFKKIKSTKFGIADTRYFTPFCFIISVLSFYYIIGMN